MYEGRLLKTSVNISILQHHLISVVGFVSCLNLQSLAKTYLMEAHVMCMK
jgi:hypothetical protein